MKLGELLKHIRVQSQCVSVIANVAHAYETERCYYSFRLSENVDTKTAFEECEDALEGEVSAVDIDKNGTVLITIKVVI